VTVGHRGRAVCCAPLAIFGGAPRATAVLAAALLLACQPGEHSETLLPSGVGADGPPDSVAPGQLAEGGERVYGLVLPRDMRVLARRDDVTYARGALPFEGLANYVRARVIAKRVETGPSRTVFVDATLKDNPKYLMQIEVRRNVSGVDLVLRNRTHKPAAKGLSPADRWRRAGMSPDGKRVDPKAE